MNHFKSTKIIRNLKKSQKFIINKQIKYRKPIITKTKKSLKIITNHQQQEKHFDMNTFFDLPSNHYNFFFF